MKSFILKALAFVALAVVTTGTPVMAAAPGGFSVTPILPPNQIEGTTGFFNLLVEPGTSQEIAVYVTNNGDETISMEMSLITATTNRNGIIDYSSPDNIFDNSMQHPFAEIARLGLDEVTIPPGESREVPIIIDVPQEGFDGIILGGIHVLLGITEEQQEAAGMIVSRFAHVIVARLENRGVIEDIDFELGNVEATLLNYRASIVADVHNPLARIVRDAHVSARIYPAGEGAVPIFARDINVDFAPNGVFQFSLVDEAGYGIVAGDYVAVISLSHEEGQWDFERAFSIEAAEAQAINVGAVNQVAPPAQPGGGGNDAVLITALIVGAVVVIAVAAMVIKAKQPKAPSKGAE